MAAYREQDPAKTAQEKIADLQSERVVLKMELADAESRAADLARENRRLRDGEATLGDRVKLIAIGTVLFGLPSAFVLFMFLSAWSDADIDAECSYQCATRGGVCVVAAPSGAVCEPGGGRYTVAPRQER